MFSNFFSKYTFKIQQKQYKIQYLFDIFKDFTFQNVLKIFKFNKLLRIIRVTAEDF